MRALFKFGLLLVGVLPIVAFVGVGSMALMPGCTGGSSGTASGCYLFGVVNLNWLVQLGTIAFVGSFITVPIGVVVILVAEFFSGSGSGKRKGDASGESREG
jgi:hypothetical protein